MREDVMTSAPEGGHDARVSGVQDQGARHQAHKATTTTARGTAALAPASLDI